MKIINLDSPYPFVLIESESDINDIYGVISDLNKKSNVRSITLQINRSLITDHFEKILKEFSFSEPDIEVKVERSLIEDLLINNSVLYDVEFKSFQEVGSSPFLAVTQKIAIVRRLKTEEGLKNLQRENFDPNLWVVGYHGNDPICIILGEVKNHRGTCLYLGIVDSFHAKGLGFPLFQKALMMLKSKGATTYYDSTDISNHAMRRIFEKSACKVTDEVLTYANGQIP